MGWENLQEELYEEFSSLAYAPDETLHRAFTKARTEGIPTGYLVRNPKPPQNLRKEGRAKVHACKECGASLEDRRANVQFCGVKCKNRFGQRTWLANHPEWKPKSRAKGTVVTVCAHTPCGKLLILGFRKTKQKYCNHDCAHKAYYARKKAGQPEVIVETRRRYNERKRLQRESERNAT